MKQALLEVYFKAETRESNREIGNDELPSAGGHFDGRELTVKPA